jgi:FkbM family methyltransferase
MGLLGELLKLSSETRRVLFRKSGFLTWGRVMTIRKGSRPLAAARLLGLVKVSERDGKTLVRLPGVQLYVSRMEGSKLEGATRDAVEQWRQAAWFDKCDAAKVLKPGMVVLDLGACYGAFTIVASRLVGPEGKVIAVKPVEDNLRALQDNTAVNALANVLPVRAAIGDHDGELTIHLGPAVGAHSAVMHSGGEEVRVPMRSVDSLVAELGLERVDLIKADVEGMEPDFLRGAAETIRRFRPHIVAAAYHFPEHRELLPTLLGEIDPHYDVTVCEVCQGSELDMYARPTPA